MDVRALWILGLSAIEGCAGRIKPVTKNKDYGGEIPEFPVGFTEVEQQPIYLEGFTGRAKGGYWDWDGYIHIANTDDYAVGEMGNGEIENPIFLGGYDADTHAMCTFPGADEVFLLWNEGADNPLNLEEQSISIDGDKGEIRKTDDDDLTSETENGNYIGNIPGVEVTDESEAEGLTCAWDDSTERGGAYFTEGGFEIFGSTISLKEDSTFDLGDLDDIDWYMDLQAALGNMGIEVNQDTIISGLAYVHEGQYAGSLLALIEGQANREAMVVQIDPALVVTDKAGKVLYDGQIVAVYGLGTFTGDEEDIFVNPEKASEIYIVIDEKENGGNAEHVADAYTLE